MIGGTRRIVLATGLTETSANAVSATLDLAASLGASVVAVHAIEPINPGNDDGDPFAGFYAHLRRACEVPLERLAERFAARDVPFTFQVPVGPRWLAVLQAAEVVGADLIVCGARARSEATAAPTGTTSQRIFLASTRPVLVVPQDAPANRPEVRALQVAGVTALLVVEEAGGGAG